MARNKRHTTYLCAALMAASALLLATCGTLEVQMDPVTTPDSEPEVTPSPWDTAAPAAATAIAPLDSPTVSLSVDVSDWGTVTYVSFGVAFRYPADWQPVPGYGDSETGTTRFAGEDGFFQVQAMDGEDLEHAAALVAGHQLQPYGSDPIVEDLRVMGQDARLILPSADQVQDMERQSALIVRNPEPIELSGHTYAFFVLLADAAHIRPIAQTLQSRVNGAPVRTVVPAVAWTNLPPGLAYSTSEGLWRIGADEEPVLLHKEPDGLPSPDGERALVRDAARGDLWLLDLAKGAIVRLTDTPERRECCTRWWPARPDIVVFASAEGESQDTSMIPSHYLSAISMAGEGYRILDSEHAIDTLSGPGEIAPSPDGQTIAYGNGSVGWLYRWGAGPEAFNPLTYGLTGIEGVQIGQPAWSPDGTRLAWIVKGDAAADGTAGWTGISLFDLAGRTARLLHPYEAQGVGWPAAPVWSPDGQWLAFTDSSPSSDAGLWVVRVDTEPAEHHLGLGGNPVWSPDGAWLAFQSTPGDGPSEFVVVRTGEWKLQPLAIPAGRYGRLVGWVAVR